jgi:hypothetical protein
MERTTSPLTSGPVAFETAIGNNRQNVAAIANRVFRCGYERCENRQSGECQNDQVSPKTTAHFAA